MTKYSLRARMLILTLAPTLLIGLLLTTFFVAHRYNQLQEQLIGVGSSIIQPLAVASRTGLNLHNRTTIQELVEHLHHNYADTVRAITIFDEHNNLFSTSSYQYHSEQLQLPESNTVLSELMLTQRGSSLILRAPIFDTRQDPHFKISTSNNSKIIGYIAIDLDMRSVRLQQYKEVFVAILLLIICLCIAMLFAYRLMRDVTVPIRNMANTVDQIRQGQMDSRVKGYMLGELNMLKNGINAMAITLSDSHEEMQQNIAQATSELRQTLEQMEIQNVELDLAKKKAQEAARIKSEFLANMSHELRTPLNGVLGFARHLQKTELTPTQKEYLQTIERSGKNLLSIIDDVLDFSKLEAGKLQLESIPFSLFDTIDEVTTLLGNSAQEKGLELTLSINRDVPEYLVGDPLRIKQILTNLLGNAIKFTHQGEITVCVELLSLRKNEAELEIQVHDTGIGIPEQQQSKLFQAFRQADASISRSHGGTGLGLVISQKLVREMGGDIRFHSQLNKGSTFWFHIRVEVDQDLTHIRSHQRKIAELEGKTLLYFESNPVAAQATLEMLEQTPLQVMHCPNIHQAPTGHFDILLYSVPLTSMPDPVLYRKRLAILHSLSDRIILALPPHIQPDAEFLKQEGVENCLRKPLSPSRLFNVLCQIQEPAASLPSPVETHRQRWPMKAMAVDDNPANLKLIGVLLEELVDEVFLCNNAEEAIDLAEKQPLDIILMDIQMPRIDGIRAAEIIRRLPMHTQTPIIAVTAHAATGERERLMKLGMDDYLSKPIDENRLIQVLENTLSSSIPPSNLMLPASEPTTMATDSERRVGESPVAPEVINWSQALTLSANKEELARDMLRMLIDFFPEVIAGVTAAMEGKTDDHILDLIHKLHGSCSYCGVPRLKQICGELESQLRAGVLPSDLEPEWLELLDEMANVQREGAFYLQS